MATDAPCGAWIATAQADHIFYEQRTSKYHQEQIILHEIGHLLCGHSLHDISETLLSGTGLRENRGTVQGALLRTSYSTQQEKEAELVASMLLERSTSWDSDSAQVAERYLAEVLGFC